MTEMRREKELLKACLGKSEKLSVLIDYATDSIVSKTILDKPAGTITLFAFDKSQKLSEHTTPYDAVVQVVNGCAKLTIGGKEIIVSSGEIIIMPADVPHAVEAEEKCKMLLTMIRS